VVAAIDLVRAELAATVSGCYRGGKPEEDCGGGFGLLATGCAPT
jgi:hypothetical protein